MINAEFSAEHRQPESPWRAQPVEAGNTTAPSGEARLNRAGDAHLDGQRDEKVSLLTLLLTWPGTHPQWEHACPLTDTLLISCCVEPKITNKNPPTKDCRSNLPAAVWRLLGFSARCRQRWSYQAVTGPRTGTGHLCLGQSRCRGESPSRTWQAG